MPGRRSICAQYNPLFRRIFCRIKVPVPSTMTRLRWLYLECNEVCSEDHSGVEWIPQKRQGRGLVQPTELSPKQRDWLFAKGTMADTIRAFDWSSSRIGSMKTWGPSLRFTLDSMLACAFPATLQWGTDLLLLGSTTISNSATA